MKSYINKNHINLYIFITTMLVLITGYLFIFQQTNRASTLDTFDTIMVQDAAQVARNTVNGNFFTTKLIFPVGYAFFSQVENHPDFIRYPFVVLMYSLLFSLFPISSATIKIFNSVCFINNGILVYILALLILNRNKIKLPDLWRNGIAALSAIFTSFIYKYYLVLSFSDSYEIPIISIILLLFIAIVMKGKPFVVGLLQGILYLCHTNLIMLFPFTLYLVLRDLKSKDRLKASVYFVVAMIITISPFFIRNLIISSKLSFSLQQAIELFVNVEASHSELYRTFSLPPSIFPIDLAFIKSLLLKFKSNIIVPFKYASKSYYLLGWIGIPFFFSQFKKERIFLISILAALFAHFIALSFILHEERVYLPLFFLITAIGYLGLFTSIMVYFAKKEKGTSRWNHNWQWISTMAILAALCIFYTNPERPERDNRTRPPSEEAIAVLQEHNIECVYSNDPFWIPWYADIVAVYNPKDLDSIYTDGPNECTHYIVDTRKTYKERFLQENATLISSGEKYLLYLLN